MWNIWPRLTFVLLEEPLLPTSAHQLVLFLLRLQTEGVMSPRASAAHEEGLPGTQLQLQGAFQACQRRSLCSASLSWEAGARLSDCCPIIGCSRQPPLLWGENWWWSSAMMLSESRQRGTPPRTSITTECINGAVIWPFSQQ